MSKLPSCMGIYREKFIWNSPRYLGHRKRWLCHFKQVHLWPCASYRQYYKKVIEILKKSLFVGGNFDSYLYIKKSKKSIAYVTLHVHDSLMIGVSETIDDAITGFRKNGLVLKMVKGLQEYLSCELKFSADKKWAWWGKPNLVKNLEGLWSIMKKILQRTSRRTDQKLDCFCFLWSTPDLKLPTWSGNCQRWMLVQNPEAIKKLLYVIR